MGTVITLVVAAAVAIGVWNMSQRQRSNRSPFPPAFGTTVVGLLFLTTGLLGIRLGKRDAFPHATWTGHVQWADVGVGVVVLFLAVWLWRKALRSISPSGR
jgi:drug/metabolite transporter (DMT)-like permease